MLKKSKFIKASLLLVLAVTSSLVFTSAVSATTTTFTAKGSGPLLYSTLYWQATNGGTLNESAFQTQIDDAATKLEPYSHMVFMEDGERFISFGAVEQRLSMCRAYPSK